MNRKEKYQEVKNEYFIDAANGKEPLGELIPKKDVFPIRLMRIKTQTHVDYGEVITKLRKVLDDIIANRKIVNSEEIRFFIDAGNRIVAHYKIENEMLIKASEGASLPYPRWFKLLVNSLLEFLSKSRNILKIKKCAVCEQYFIAKKNDREVCYPPQDCENIRKRNYQREFMKKKREEGDSRYM